MTRAINPDSLWLKWLVGIALAGALAWFVNASDWVEEVLPLPMRGEAATKPYYAAAQVLRRIGVRVVERQNLDTLPPPGATLVLASSFWSMFPDRVERLKAWVTQQGGHLVVPRYLVREDELGRWLPIRFEALPRMTKEQVLQARAAASSVVGRDAQAVAASASGVTDADRNEDTVQIPFDRARPGDVGAGIPRRNATASRGSYSCTLRHEPAGRAATFADQHDYRICYSGGERFIVDPAVLEWSLDGRRGPMTARVRVGRGSVLVEDTYQMFENQGFLLGDNALAFLAGLNVSAGDEVWFVADETRPPLWLWLWQRAALVLLLGAAALAGALWRNGLRFGPRLAAPASGRRSMSEQARGTAEFVWQRGPRALHAAQLRALDEVALHRVRGYARLERSARASALARATGHDAAAIGLALDGRIVRPRAAWPAVLALLEAVRRQLLAGAKK